MRAEKWWVRAQGPYCPALVEALKKTTEIPTLFSPYLYYPTLFGTHAAPRPRVLMPAAHDELPLHLGLVRGAVVACDAIWYQTEEERHLLERTHPVSATKPYAVGAVGVEPQPGADAQRFRSRYGIDGPFLLFSGRTASGKGFSELTDWFTSLRGARNDVQLVVTGGSVGEPRPPGVRALGRIDSDSLHDALAAATAVIVPSRMESLSMIALEAWAAGRPCLLNGRSPVLRGQAGRSGGALLVSNQAEFADAAVKLVDDPELGSRMGEAGRAYVASNYRWDDVVARLTNLLSEAHTGTSRDPD